MKMRPATAAGVLLCIAMLCMAGCANYETRTYDVTVKNGTSRNITVWLTKDGPPYEAKWASPEDLATERPGGSNVYLGVVVPPGKSGATGPIAGKFEPHTRAYVRVYGYGERFSDLLATGRGDPTRLDLELQPGENQFVVTEKSGRLAAERTPAAGQ